MQNTTDTQEPKKFFSKKTNIENFDIPTIWSKFSKLALKTDSVNMGQGFPDWNPPEFFTQSLIKHIETGNHQYCRTYGTKYLVESIARNYSVSYERKIDPMTEVIVTPGAVAGLYNAITGFISEGDEVIINEPFYDCYLPQIKFSGGIAIGSPLIPPPKSKLLLLIF